MIYVGIGANLDHPKFGAPQKTCKTALNSLNKEYIRITKCSRWYVSAAVPASSQPDYINAVIQIETKLEPQSLLNYLLDTELKFGRMRDVKNAARTLDLDLIDYQGQIIESDTGLNLPHPRLTERAFVLLPLAELDQNWRHPSSGQSISSLIDQLRVDQTAHVLEDNPDDYGTA